MGWNWFGSARSVALRSAVAGMLGAVVSGAPARAQNIGQPTPWKLGMQEGVTPVMADMANFHDLLMWIITLISVFVLVLLVIRLRAPPCGK